MRNRSSSINFLVCLYFPYYKYFWLISTALAAFLFHIRLLYNHKNSDVCYTKQQQLYHISLSNNMSFFFYFFCCSKKNAQQIYRKKVEWQIFIKVILRKFVAMNILQLYMTTLLNDIVEFHIANNIAP